MVYDFLTAQEVKGFLDYRARKAERQTEYFHSDEFSNLLGIIRAHDSVHLESLRYNTQQIDGLSADSFSNVCNAIYQVLDSETVKDPESSFPKYHIDHDGIRFHLMIGQGSTYWTKKLE